MTSDSNKKWLRHAIPKSMLVAAGICTAFFISEIILRFIDVGRYDELSNDPKTGLLLYNPETDHLESSACFSNSAHMNSLGLYGPEILPDKKPGEYRIIVVGSSFTESLQVPLDKRFDNLLQNTLNQSKAHGDTTITVTSLGFSGNGTFLDMLYFKDYVASLHPDLVVDLMTDYDLTQDSASANQPPRFDQNGNVILELPAAKTDSRMIFIKSALRKSRLFEILYEKFLTAKVVLEKPQTTASTTEVLSSDIWNVEGTLLSEFKSIVGQRDAKFLLISWTTENFKSDRTYMSAHLVPIAEKDNIRYFDLTPALERAEEDTGKSPTWSCDGHWDENGHIWVANALANYLESNPALLQ